MEAPAFKVNVGGRISAGAALFALALALAGCVPRAPDTEALRQCRRVAAVLGPPGSRVELLAQTGRPLDNGLDLSRLDVAVHAPGRPTRRDFVVCRAKPEPDGRATLLAVATERGPMPDASLFLIKRFWLDTAAAADEARAMLDAAP